MHFKKIVALFPLLFAFPAAAELNPSGQKQTFTITGYYSPLPNQEFYVTGDYASEIRLNGRGIAGADGTLVFPGMIAAPPSFPFGTKICIPSFGCGVVHDRGQAIVQQGERALARHDRLDLWMGHGVEGLRRALAFGVQHLESEVFAPDSPVQISVNFDVPPALFDLISVPPKNVFAKNLRRGDSGHEVEKLQQALQNLGFFDAEIDGLFDIFLQNAVFAFQKKHFLVREKTDLGAGIFGPATRGKLSEVLQKKSVETEIQKMWDAFHFSENLKRGDRGADVFRLQEMLVQTEYLLVRPTGFFGPKTENAVKNFQTDFEILSEKNSGQMDFRTREKLNLILENRKNQLKTERQKVAAAHKNMQKFSQFAGQNFEPSASLAFGSRGDSVADLQQKLAAKGYLSSQNISGFFGSATRQAVRDFQLDFGIISAENLKGAGTFGPATQQKFFELSRG